MKIEKYFLLQNKKIKSWIKYWLYIKSKDKNYVLSDILQGTSFYLENSSNKNFNLFQINGNSMQDGTPTPTNPVEIKSAGDNINEVISNKNLCNGINQNYFINTNATRVGVASDNSGLLIKTDRISSYTISTKVLQARFRVGVSETIPTTVGGITLYNGQVKDGTNNSITINSNGYDYLIVNATDLTNIQIEKGSSATSFVEHQEQNYTIPCQQPMRSIGDIRDVFVKQDGLWYEKHNIGQIVLNGTESGWIYDSDNFYFRKSNYTFEHTPKANTNDTVQLSNYFKHTSGWGTFRTSHTTNLFYSVQNSGYKLCFRNVDITTVSDWTSWLQNHNVEVIYPTEEPYYLECTEEQIEALESITQAYTYKQGTNINSTDETPAYLNIQYYMEV